ncbi:unnamed protein product [Rangifer tarandus platyrhynchus]|uniref:Uncharacterized protein n=2 Tax=Rangifer tarandus platyrhynchus TaxID=3082113 RepID=A0ABN8Z5H1_RANTA|nr:unnamed protein product [Rangifer tarandus platyrhynchus]CAI9703973.1 unnamed protein product [Rangifer tarandus platyrhynchus]
MLTPSAWSRIAGFVPGLHIPACKRCAPTAATGLGPAHTGTRPPAGVFWARRPAQDLSPRPQLLTLHGGPGCCADTPVAGVSAPPAAALAPSQQQGKGPIAQDPVRASVTGTRNGSGGKAQSL